MIENGVASEYTLEGIKSASISTGVITDFDSPSLISICMPCIICEESIELNKKEQDRISYGLSINPKVCDKCKAAVLKMRESM